jgi:hypothetical protein
VARNHGLRLPPLRLSPALLCLGAVVALTIFAQTQPGQSALTRLGVIGPSQRYTELAFVGAQHLPTTLLRTSTRLHLPFIITDREGRAERYGWAVLNGISATATRKLATGETSLRPDQKAYVDPALTIGCTGSQTRVAIRLTSGQVIDFIAQCVGRSAARRR